VDCNPNRTWPVFSLTVPRRQFNIFWRSPLSNWKFKIKIRKIENSKNSYFFMSVASLYTSCFVMFCVFLYGPFCHGAHKLDLSTLFTTFFLWTSLPFILKLIINIPNLIDAVFQKLLSGHQILRTDGRTNGRTDRGNT